MICLRSTVMNCTRTGVDIGTKIINRGKRSMHMSRHLVVPAVILVAMLFCGCITYERTEGTLSPTTTTAPTTPPSTTTAYPTTPVPTWSAPEEKVVAEGDYTMFGRKTLQVMAIDIEKNEVVYSINEHGLQTLKVPFSTRMQDDFYIEYLSLYIGDDGKKYLKIRYSIYG